MTIIHIGAAAYTGSEALPSGADARTYSDSQQFEMTQNPDDNTSSSTRIENLDENELSVTDPLMGLSQDMTSGSTADSSVSDNAATHNFVSSSACIIISTGRSPTADIYL